MAGRYKILCFDTFHLHLCVHVVIKSLPLSILMFSPWYTVMCLKWIDFIVSVWMLHHFIFSALSQVISCILILLHMAFFSYQPWQNFPVADYIPLRFTYYTILNAYPDMSLNFGFFIGAGAALLSLVAAVMLWIQACCTYCHLRNVRYNMLREKPDLGSSPLPTKGSYFNPAFVRTSPQEYPAVVHAAPTPQFAPYKPPTQYTTGMELDLWSFISSSVINYLGTIVSFYSWFNVFCTHCTFVML